MSGNDIAVVWFGPLAGSTFHRRNSTVATVGEIGIFQCGLDAAAEIWRPIRWQGGLGLLASDC